MSNLFTSKLYKYLFPILFTCVLIFSWEKNYKMPVDTSNPAHIVFIENSWDKALKEAKTQNKYIFVDAYASWCGPCKMLKATTFNDSKAADFYNSNFINVSIDIEKGEGPALAVQWGIQAYPTLIIFNSAGKPVLGTVGYISAADLIKFGKQALNK